LTWLGSAANATDLRGFILEDKPEAEFGFDGNGNLPKAESNSNVADPAALMLQAMQLLAESAKSGASKDDLEEIRGDIAEANDALRRQMDAKLEELSNRPAPASVKTLRIEVAERDPVELSGLRHKDFDDLLADVLAFEATGETARANFWLVGEAGTGKTTAIEKIAEALSLPFYFNGAIDSEYKLRGFIDAQGRIVSTPFRKAYETGGVYLFDEVDSSLPSACLAFNAALANGQYDFPGVDEPVRRHKSNFVFAASNTWGGPSGDYVGRFKQDGAFMDRFMRVEWNTDEELESSLCSHPDWCAFVQCCRAKALEHGIQHIISPRATFNGAAMLAAGRPWERVVKMCVRKGLDDADWGKITGRN
jgi:hypothetical protein